MDIVIKVVTQFRVNRGIDQYKVTKQHYIDKFFAEINDCLFQPYTPGRDDNILKWKPSSHNSIDFKLMISKDSGLG